MEAVFFSLNLVQGGIKLSADQIANDLKSFDEDKVNRIKGKPVSRMDVGSQSRTGMEVSVFSINVHGREFIIVEDRHDASKDRDVSWDHVTILSTVYVRNDQREQIQVDREVQINEEVILEAGDRIQVVKERSDVTIGILKSWISDLMGNNTNTADYSLYRDLYEDLEKYNSWYDFVKELNTNNITSKSEFEDYIRKI